ncbi:tRNA lysidine(34) synthetase TilS [Arthrobacter sp. M4]|uniref:tRNA lysidine(34) synthetase TilS n=1 Tax=Arthrobacter sp. M4 TaxID=218160 RepID=UPI001CDBF8E1|nr:tRNA lysidine(34) synthetase TilS [Arthrobacter sp. M4]MCA4135205.1 tRNA lysidine(34) synthetase TilS [Arthrobacter sp. M4]
MLQDALASVGYPQRILVACSGGPDSLALAAVAAYFARRGHVDGHPIAVAAAVVDHQLQAGSAAVAERTAGILGDLGLSPVVVRAVDVASTGFGPEAAARDARHAALDRLADELDCSFILLGHTLDDQAEQVLLGLARGSGTRSLSGMRPLRGRLLRPFLGLRRSETLEICTVEGLEPWHDPSNADTSLARSRTRVEVMPILEEKLGPGVAESLARTASILQQDADFLDELAEARYGELAVKSDDGVWLPEDDVREMPPALRFRVIAKAAAAVGGQQPSHGRLQAAEALLRRRGSAGPVQLPGGVSVYRVSLAELERERATVDKLDDANFVGDRARCGKLVFRQLTSPQP